MKRTSVCHQLAVASLLYLLVAEAARLVNLVVGVAALEEEHLAVALEGKDVGADAVEEPAVVADYHGAAGKRLKTFLQRTQRVDINIVGRLVEKQHVALLLQSQGKLQAVALTAGEGAAELVLVGSGKVEARDVGTGINVSAAHADLFGSISLCCWST